MSYQDTSLWGKAFDIREDDDQTDERLRLRTALLTMREQVKALVAHIPSDCKELTVHDITHLDALWESADLLCGANLELNPAECFVLGAAILIHDAGLTSIAYPEGRAGLKKLPVWEDLVASEKQLTGNDNLLPHQEASILFTVLRELHAKQAESLCTQSWKLDGGSDIFLLSDSELREAYGESIGRIAHSHHWPINRVAQDLNTQMGGSPTLPAAWEINEQKLACILRCADAAQVDRTRAPLLLYAAVNPHGFSKMHWQAQSKLNRPTLRADTIQFASSSSFKVDDADAWWLAFDLAVVLDSELKSSNALLTEIGLPPFAAQRVAGAGSPRAFSNSVKPKDWQPIDASVRVSDPMALARKLGGQTLYGRDLVVPFRELIQNAADAIRARRALEKRGIEFGRIEVTIEQHPHIEDRCLVHVDDNGLGMSARVLTTTLVDFGKSFWGSSTLREEFPGLSATGVKHIGKFGIGFFSVFDYSDEVSVVSKRYDLGQQDTNSLEFRGLVSRPLLRGGAELPIDKSTRVSLSVEKADFTVERGVEDQQLDMYRWPDAKWASRHGTIREELLRMVSFLDVDVSFSDLRNGEKFMHKADVYGSESETFLDELLSGRGVEKSQRYDMTAMLRPISNEVGDSFGRATLDIDALLEGSIRFETKGAVAVGGIIGSRHGVALKTDRGVRIPFVGVVDGETDRASREYSTTRVPHEAIESWLDGQLELVDFEVLKTSEKMAIGGFAYAALGSKHNIPILFHKGQVKTALFLESFARSNPRLVVPALFKYESWLEAVGYDDLKPEYFETTMLDEVVVGGDSPNRMVSEDDARTLYKEGGGPISPEDFQKGGPGPALLLKIIQDTWGRTPSITLGKQKIFDTRSPSLSTARWGFAIE